MPAFLLAVLLGMPYSMPGSGAYVPATIVAVRPAASMVPYSSTDPSDAPLSADVYEYEVVVRVPCETYVARYWSPLPGLPGRVASGRRTLIRVGKHNLYLRTRGADDLRLPIVSRKKPSGCLAKR